MPLGAKFPDISQKSKNSSRISPIGGTVLADSFIFARLVNKSATSLGAPSIHNIVRFRGEWRLLSAANILRKRRIPG